MRILYLPDEYSQQRQQEKPANIYPVRMAMEAEWYRQQGHDVHWGVKISCQHDWHLLTDIDQKKFWWCEKCKKQTDRIISEPENLPFLSLPKPDRVFTNAKSYTSGNYKYLPGTHMQVADGCWWGKCEFCVEKDKKYCVRTIDSVIEEIEECKRLGFKEIFDDSGTFPVGVWLDKFCQRMKGNKTPLGCNMRVANIDYGAMKEAGFRMLLFGIESANSYTLNKINKGITRPDIKKYIKQASDAGLEPHICAMFGYPWEDDENAENTLDLVHWLLKKGYAKTAQASFYTVPSMLPNFKHKKYIPLIYDVAYSPEFWFNQLRDIKDLDDIKYLLRKIKVGLRK